MPKPCTATRALLVSTSLMLAQAPATSADFPADAQPLAADALRQRLSGKLFNVKTAAGTAWRLQYQGNGYFFINVGGFSDSGKWRTEESKLCSEPQKSAASCNEMRLVGEVLYLKRDSGEIIKLEPN